MLIMEGQKPTSAHMPDWVYRIQDCKMFTENPPSPQLTASMKKNISKSSLRRPPQRRLPNLPLDLLEPAMHRPQALALLATHALASGLARRLLVVHGRVRRVVLVAELLGHVDAL